MATGVKRVKPEILPARFTGKISSKAADVTWQPGLQHPFCFWLMDLDRTKPLASGTRHLYRCPCGHDVEIDSQRGGKCESCGRIIPAGVTRFPLSMTMTLADVGPDLTGTRAAGDTSRPEQLVGRQLGHFEIIESIGRGGMGQVYRALDTSLQRYVAVKVIQGTACNEIDSVAQQRLMREAVAQARVNHPNIVTIYFVGREDNIPFLAMELIDGYDIAELISQGEIPYESLCRTAIKITHALDTASQMGIVHSDIKPQNLLVLSNGEVKLSDFGMARIADSGDQDSVGGTPNYLAPELLQGQPPTAQSDMYALGVTLYEMTFGKLPVALSGSTPGEWAQIHKRARIRFPEKWPEHLPLGWRDILGRLLARDPEHRYADYQQLGNDLNRILPIPRPDARRLPRVIAWFIDVATIALMAVPFILLLQMVQQIGKIRALPHVTGDLFLLLSLAAFTMVVSGWRQSLGRELLHIKVVNQYGLLPSRRTMATRSVLRMLPLWCVAIGWLAGAMFSFVVPVVIVLGIGWSIIDAAFMLIRGAGSSLHDRILHTRAVAGSDRD